MAAGWRPPFSPYDRISQVPLLEVQNMLCKIFERRNKPGSFRVDNGEPFGTPCNDTPPPLALWLIGYDVDVIWNKPRCPQMNGVVEHLQDTSSRWAEVNTCPSCEVLQHRLDEQARVQRSVFPVTRLKNQTRLQAFPLLEKSERTWNPADFDPQRVYDFLAKKIFPRKISISGQIRHFGQRIYVHTALKGLVVHIKLDIKTMEWVIYNDYKVVKKYSALPALGLQQIQNLSVYQRTRVETIDR